MSKMLRFSDLCAENLAAGKRVLIRSDFNVPLDAQGRITDDSRLRAGLPCLQMALQAGAAVLVMSHLGRPTEGQPRPEDSLQPVASWLSEHLQQNVALVRNWLDGVPVAPGQLVLLENCRLNVGEKANDDKLSRRMAALCDIYVNDAFGAAHRAQASTHGVARYVGLACAGPLLLSEVQAIGRALQAPERPLFAIVGGSKVSSKLSVLRQLARKVDGLIVGGGIANTFMLAAGLPIGRSLAEADLVGEAQAIIALMAERGAQVAIPEDVVVANEFSARATARTKATTEVSDDELILDLGPRTMATLTAQLEQARTIVWNGPLGVFEWPAFADGTQALAKAVAASSAFSLAGGGDTLAAIAQFGIDQQIDYISTGGGAFLEMLEGKPLPAVAVLEQRAAGQNA